MNYRQMSPLILSVILATTMLGCGSPAPAPEAEAPVGETTDEAEAIEEAVVLILDETEAAEEEVIEEDAVEPEE